MKSYVDHQVSAAITSSINRIRLGAHLVVGGILNRVGNKHALRISQAPARPPESVLRP